MPDFIAVPGSIEFRVTGTHVGGKKMYNIGHVDCGSPLPTLAQCEAVADAVANWCAISYSACYSNKITINEVRARSNAAEPGPVYTNSTINQIGTLGGDQLSMDTTLCCNLLTGLTGASHRGRWFTFLADESVMTDGLFTGVYQSLVEARMGDLLSDLNAAGFALAIESRRHLALYQVSSFLGQRIPSKLRSRKVNRGI